MKVNIPYPKTIHFFTDSLIKNGIFILGVNVLPGIAGFLFWGIASRIFSPADIGWGSAVLSAASLIAGIAAPGVGIGIIHFLPITEKRKELIDSSVAYTVISSILGVIIFLAGIHVWSPGIADLLADPFLVLFFLILVVSSNLGTTFRGLSVARRKSEHAFSYTLFANLLKIFLILLLLFIGPESIIVSTAVAMLVSVIYYYLILIPKTEPGYRLGLNINLSILKDIIPYSLTNYIATFIFQSYQLLLPIVIINILGSEANAYSYPALMIGGFITQPGAALAYSSFAEGSNDQKSVPHLMRKVMGVSTVVTLGISLAAYIIAPLILLIFGQAYSVNGTLLLRLIIISSPIAVINHIYLNYLRLKDDSRKLLIVSFELAIFVVSISLIGMKHFGVNGVGYSLLIGNLMVVIANLFGIASMCGYNLRYNPKGSI